MALYINGQQVAQEMLDQEVERLRPDYDQYVTDVQGDEKEMQLHRWARENVIEQVLLRQAAHHDLGKVDEEKLNEQFTEIENNCGGREELLKQLETSGLTEAMLKEQIAADMKFQQMMARITSSALKPTEEQAKEYYTENKDEFMAGDMVHAAHIVRRPRDSEDVEKVHAELHQILTKIRNGASFQEQASIASDCPESAGDLGTFGRGQMVQSFEDVVFALEVGQVSDIFETEFGLHIATVYDKKPPRMLDFDEVKGHIMERLENENQQKAVEDFVDVLREKATIEDK
ncbi:MAG: peptidylprolyl isomerase [Phycisphaerae bacterium]|nr:peptidylprolyl isomerase [Phycisphaerae bacterium]